MTNALISLICLILAAVCAVVAEIEHGEHGPTLLFTGTLTAAIAFATVVAISFWQAIA